MEPRHTPRVSSHAVERYRERAGDPTSTYAAVVEKIKEIARQCPIVEGVRDTRYIRATGSGHDPIWLVVRADTVRTVLTHNQYIHNLETGRAS